MFKRLLKHSETIKAVVILGIIVAITFAVASTLKVHASKETYHDAATIQAEAEYVDLVKETLISFGMNNAGVALLKTVEPGSGVAYTLNIHHQLIDRSDRAKRIDINNSLKAIVAPDRDAIVDIVFF